MNTLNASGKTSITIDGSTLLNGDYSVSNKDLIISTDSDTTLVKDYFVDLPNLVSPQGATLTPNLVSSLSAYQPNKFVAFEDPKAIGEITVTDGPIVITRQGQKIELNTNLFYILIFLALFPSIGSYYCWAGAVSIIGANRAGIFLSLIPLFSTIMAIFFYNEQFQFFHLIGAILIILGLFLSNKEIKNA